MVALRKVLCFLLFVAVAAVAPARAASNDAPKLTLAEQEEFLRTAKVVSMKNLGTGVTNSRKATLDNGKFQHDAHIQVINESKASFAGQRRTELNFKDTYKYNVAAYELAKILELNMVPPSVDRKIGGETAAVTWWVDGTAMTEADRTKKNLSPPNTLLWNREMQIVRVFDQLIYNTDRNLQNLVITTEWRIWMIDHTRAFRMSHDLENAKNLSLCERHLLAKMKELNKATLQSKLHAWVGNPEIDGLLARRDTIVKFFDKEAAAKGEAMVYYELPPRE